MFLIKTVTLVVAILIIIAGILALTSKSKRKQKGKITLKKINDQFDEIAQMIHESILSKTALKEKTKAIKRKFKARGKSKSTPPRIFVIHFQGDIKASAVSALRNEVTAILLTAEPKDRVLCCLESPGGMVNTYGLAASQLRRLKEANLKLVVAVDKVAASGGYMMACVADEIIAAPFAILGSIGVVAQLPNFHRFLEKKNIDFEQITAGEYKRTLTMLGKNTHKAREKMQQDINDIHTLFKDFIRENRACVDIEKVATGEYWFGTRALELKLVDHLKTSDDYILNAKDEFDIYRVQYHIKKSLSKRIAESTQAILGKLFQLNTQGGQDYLP